MEEFISPLPVDGPCVMLPPIQNFFFLIFYSNPSQDRVYIYPDGDEHRIMLSHSKFIELITSLSGYNVLTGIYNAISTYGTFWLYDREREKVQRIVMKGTDDLKTIQSQIHKALKKETTPEQNPLNPAENLAYTPVNIELPQGKNPFVTEEEAPSQSPTVRIKNSSH